MAAAYSPGVELATKLKGVRTAAHFRARWRLRGELVWRGLAVRQLKQSFICFADISQIGGNER